MGPFRLYHSGDTVLYPGHNYAPQNTSTIAKEKKTNVFMRFDRLEDFLQMMGYPG